MTLHCPALLITAMASGQGKTLTVAALARLHARQGRRVRVFKCGPDFLDPLWHELASGAPAQTLDLWMTGEADIRARLHEAAGQADLILVEGVMGLFDGKPSVADLAELLQIPVLPVLHAGSMAQSIGAVAHGLRHYRAGLRWAGVLANGVASAHHADLLREALLEQGDWLGALPRLAVPQPAAGASVDVAASAPAEVGLLPERHLGLVPAAEMQDALQRLDAAADALAQTPLGQLDWPEWQRRWSVPFEAVPAPAERLPQRLRGRKIAVARDAAFAFIYPANLATLEALGARVVFFSPLAGHRLPPCDAVWLPGGYPELHAAPLCANTALRADLAAHLAAGKPLWAECGGMLALCESVQHTNGQSEPLWGLLPGQARMQPRLAGLGHQQLQLPAACGRGAARQAPLRGHTFHYSTLASEAPVVARTVRPVPRRTPDAGEALYQLGSLRASYFHAWFPSSPLAVATLLGSAGGSGAA